MKKKNIVSVVSLVLVLVLIGTFTGCGKSDADKGITVVKVADRIDIPELWEAVNEILESENIRVENKAYDSSVNLNDLLLSGDIDMNVAQHYAAIDYFKASNEKYNDLVALGEISTESLDIYSNKHNSLDELPDEALIAIPSDVMNGGRAFVNLQKSGLIKLNNDYEQFPEEGNIIENPKNLKFTSVDTTSMVRILDDVDAGFIYSPTAVYGGLNPKGDPIWEDSVDLSDPFELQFVLVFTGVAGDENNEVYKKVIDAYHSDAVFKVYKDVLNGGSLPVVEQKVIDLDKY